MKKEKLTLSIVQYGFMCLCLALGFTVTVNALTIINNGTCMVPIYHWVADGDIYIVDLPPCGGSIEVNSWYGEMWRAIDDFSNTQFDQSFTDYGQGTWTIYPNFCNGYCPTNICNLSVYTGNDESICEGESTVITTNVTNETYYCCNYDLSGLIYLGQHDGQDYYKNPAGDVTWNAANNEAIARGGSLPVVNNVSTNNFLKSQVLGLESLWLGLTDVVSEGDFHWVDGSSLSYTDWANNEPNNSYNEDYVELLDVGWNDNNGSTIAWRVFCFPVCNNNVSYQWSTGVTTSHLSVTTPGTYSVTVTDCAGCVAIEEVVIEQNNINTSVNNDGPITCTQSNVQLNALSANNAIYQWTGPNGFTSSQQNPTVNESGTYTVTVTSNGCTDTASTTVGSDISNVNASASNNGPISCTQSSVQLSASGGSFYQWTGPNGFSSSQQNPTVGESGTYTVTVTSNGCSGTASTTVESDNINAMATVMDSGPITCDNSSTAISASTNITNPSYNWTGPGGFTANGTSASVSTAGTYTVTINGDGGCTATASVDVINDIEDLVSGISAPNMACVNEGAFFQATAAGTGVSYLWDFGVGATPSTSNSLTETVSWSTGGSKTVTLTVTKNGCVSEYEAIIVVSPAVFAAAGPDVAICEGGTVMLGGMPAGPVGVGCFK